MANDFSYKENKTNFVRVVKDSNYTTINNTCLKDKRLSWKAKGIMAYLLSLPDDWNINLNEVITHSPEGEKSFRSGFNELKKLGYIKRIQIRNENKIVGWETIIFEKPETVDTTLFAQKLHVANVHVQNEALINTELLQSTKDTNKDIHQQVDEVAKVQQWEIDFNEFWKLYPRKIEKKKASSAYKTKHKLHGRETILNGLKNYLQEIQIKNTSTQYIKHPTSYLNGESYFNEPDLKPINQSQQNNLFNPWEEEQYDYRTNQNIIHDHRQQLPNTPKQIGF